jgi:hypothetical protein
MDMTYENLQQPLTQKKGGFSAWTLVIVILITFFIAFLVFKNIDRIGNWISGGALETSSVFRIGQSTRLSGTILQNGDYITYTHTLTLPDTTVVGLKSKSIDLNAYSGFVEVDGIVEKQQNQLFIIEVTNISGASAIVTT